MKLTGSKWLWNWNSCGVRRLVAFVLSAWLLYFIWPTRVKAEVGTTTVQGIVYLANGQPGSGMLHVSWPGFTTANGQAVVADSADVMIGQDGFLTLNLAPNQGAMPGGLFYTAVFYMDDGSTSTQYWVVPAAAQASLAQVQAQVMPAAQAVQAVNKAYVDGAIAQLSETLLTGSGGTLTGPLFLSGDPTQPLQAADKHYVDSAISLAGVGGGNVNPANPGQIAYYASNGVSLDGMSTVPVSAGGTGSTAADGALRNLGGVSTVATSVQTMNGPLNAPIGDRGGEKFDVSTFGAKGDCTTWGATASCSKNRAAIQAAIDAAVAVKGYVYFPPNPGAVGAQSVYYVEGTLNPKGVSMVAPQRGDIVHTGVAVRGAPGKDVFAPGDPTSSGYVKPNPTFHWTNLEIIVDDSIDASASFPNRLPGKTVFDGAISSASSVLNSSTMLFQPGDVGSAIRVYGAGPGGAVLDTTIASWQSQSRVTLADAASTSVSGAHLYLSIKGLSVTQTIGNCGLAYDDYASSAYLSHGVIHSGFENVSIVSLSNNSHNYTCGYFFQGDGGTYDTHWTSNYVQALDFGLVFANPTSGSLSGASGMADLNSYDNGFIGATYPWISYGGNQDKISALQLCDGQGPHILPAPNSTGVPWPNGWSIDIPEEECSSPGAISYRISGKNHDIPRLASAGQSTLQWDADHSKINLVSNETTMNIAGNQNDWVIHDYPQGNALTFNVTGFGNTYKTLTCGSGNCASKPQFVGGNGGQFANSYGQPMLSRSSIAFDRKADFIWDGDEAYFFNRDDLWLWPTDVNATGGYTTTFQKDSTSTTGYLLLANNAGYLLSGSSGAGWYIGKQIPAKKLRLIIRAKANTPISGWTATLATNSGGYTGICNVTMNLTTTAQSGYCDGDASGYSGSSAYIGISASGDISKQVQIEYLAIRPWTTKILASDVQTSTLAIGTSFQLAGGTAMTGNRGNGIYVQHSDGTGTTGNAAIFGVDGSITNGPALPATITGTVASGTISLATGAIASGSCQAVTAGTLNSAVATGVLATDTITFTPNGSIKAVVGYAPSTNGGLAITAYPTAGFVNFDVCNWSGSSITPGAVTVNWKVTR